jgi:hypothetical protein
MGPKAVLLRPVAEALLRGRGTQAARRAQEKITSTAVTRPRGRGRSRRPGAPAARPKVGLDRGQRSASSGKISTTRCPPGSAKSRPRSRSRGCEFGEDLDDQVSPAARPKVDLDRGQRSASSGKISTTRCPPGSAKSRCRSRSRGCELGEDLDDQVPPAARPKVGLDRGQRSASSGKISTTRCPRGSAKSRPRSRSALGQLGEDLRLDKALRGRAAGRAARGSVPPRAPRPRPAQARSRDAVRSLIMSDFATRIRGRPKVDPDRGESRGRSDTYCPRVEEGSLR